MMRTFRRHTATALMLEPRRMICDLAPASELQATALRFEQGCWALYACRSAPVRHRLSH
jgi:hypothetical protein